MILVKVLYARLDISDRKEKVLSAIQLCIFYRNSFRCFLWLSSVTWNI